MYWESVMPELAHETNANLDSSAKQVEASEHDAVQPDSQDGDLLPTIATVAVVGIGAAAFEAALLPVPSGVAAMCAPRFLPQIGGVHFQLGPAPRVLIGTDQVADNERRRRARGSAPSALRNLDEQKVETP
jgi:hypothetical protein